MTDNVVGCVTAGVISSVFVDGTKFIVSDPEKTEPADLLEFMRKAAKLLILGPWESRAGSGDPDFWIRQTPGQTDGSNARVSVWKSWPGKYGDKSYCQQAGWYWELGFGVAGFGRVANYDVPLETREDAQRIVDECLMNRPCTVVVDPMLPNCCDCIPGSFTAIVS